MFPKDKTYGIAITQYLSPHGSINLIKDVELEYRGSVAYSTYYGGYAYAMELEDCIYRYLQGRDVQMETDIQHPGDDSYKDQYICEVGIEVHNESKHGRLTGVTG
uniref:Putative structural protein n=1 Tax=viral metagenome TaxID=1070528 RepID=A0A6M3IKP6_9ZZZZ